jgi:predicted Rossmann fold flavoprotein
VNKYDVVIVGAGAAGLIAGVRAAELGAKVLLLEKMHRAGTKLLITGKGRCNITNTASVAESIQYIHPNGRFLKHAFSQFFSKEIIALLKECGVETTEERGGRIFPVSNEASNVLNALLNKAKKHQVEIQYNSKVEKLLIQHDEVTGVEISRDNQKKQVLAKCIIICTGGKSYPATGSTGDGYILAESVGHSIEPVRPALVPLVTEGKMAERLQGLSLKNVKAMVWMNGKKQKEEFGEMLFTHFGLSGPIILTLSRFVVDEILKKNNIEITIDLKPALDEQKLDARLLRDLNEHGKKNMDNIFKLWLLQ